MFVCEEIKELKIVNPKEGDTLTLNGLIYTCVENQKKDNSQFTRKGNNRNIAEDLVDSINNDNRIGIYNKILASYIGNGNISFKMETDYNVDRIILSTPYNK